MNRNIKLYILVQSSAISKKAKILSSDTPFSKDLVSAVSDTVYTIRNVPNYEMNAEGQDYHDLDVVNLLTMVRNLMYADEIPHTVDFNDIAGLV